MILLHSAFDWNELTRLALRSRFMDEMEEDELTPQGHVTYQFSARGHELGQLLISQLLDHPHDAVSPYYRSRPLMLGLGLTLKEALASDMARAGGMSDGRDVGVVFHMPRRGRAMVLPIGGDVGSQYTPSTGWAQALYYRHEVLAETDVQGGIAVVFGGDGSVASNGFWSALTIATTLQLPLLFVIEDNGFAISVRGPAQTPGSNIAKNLMSFTNLRIWDTTGTDPIQTATVVQEAINTVRQWEGPGLLRLTTPRLSGHSSVDNQAYKSKEELEAEWERDPIKALHHHLIAAGMTEAEWNQWVDEAKADVERARDAALAQPQPDPQTITRYTYAIPDEPQRIGGLVGLGLQPPQGSPTINVSDPRRINMIEAIRRTLDVELTLNPRCLVFGEDVGEKGGVHAATLDLQRKHGANRVFDTSLSEEGIIGRSVGMAYAGLVPVPEIQFRKYADPATEQLNNCGTIRWRTHNQFAAPIIVRIPGGYRKIGDPWHSVTSEIVFAHAVGWKLAFPSNAEDAVGLLRTALRGNDPVIFFEHRAMLDAAWARRPYPGDEYILPFGQAKRVHEGDDLTVVTWGAMVERCEMAAQGLDASIEIIDLRTIVPWDKTMVLESVAKTSKCLIVHEDIELGGFGAEIAATLADKAFLDLDAPIQRIAAPSVPIPFNTGLMDAVVPTVAQIQTAMQELIAY